ncbi:hypothetical protein [Pseudomonas sp. LRF_L74]|uniref:hypothetical protein n=1 Tax=Pseudomonas sp. LRF_L74 TaxID=3369422 RepID=UPI003F5F5986
MVFVQLLARRPHDDALLRALSTLLLRFSPESIDSPVAPNAYLIEIDKRGS